MESTTTAQLIPPVPPLFDEARLAIGGFLARYSGSTRSGYACDLRAWFSWCAQGDLDVLAARRVHIELYPRWMEEDQHLARATIGRRLSTVVGFYRFAVVDGYMAESPAEHVRPPKMDTESTTLGLDRMELGAFLAQAEPQGRSTTHWPVSWACWDCVSPRPAASTSRASAPSAGIGRSPWSARERRRPSSPCRPGWPGQWTWLRASASAVRCCSPGQDSASIATAPPASCAVSHDGRESSSTSRRTR